MTRLSIFSCKLPSSYNVPTMTCHGWHRDLGIPHISVLLVLLAQACAPGRSQVMPGKGTWCPKPAPGDWQCPMNSLLSEFLAFTGAGQHREGQCGLWYQSIVLLHVSGTDLHHALNASAALVVGTREHQTLAKPPEQFHCGFSPSVISAELLAPQTKAIWVFFPANPPLSAAPLPSSPTLLT